MKATTDLAGPQPAALSVRKPPKEALAQLEQVVVQGNLAALSEGERIAYYARVCESLGLNPLTRPFEYITLNNRLTLYARKDATDQLRDLHGVTIGRIERERDAEQGLAIVTAYARDRYGREDASIGVVSVKGLSGENLANALMKAETKAKRRVTLSICGLGWMDEIEAQDRQRAEVAPREALASGIAARRAALIDSEPARSPAPDGAGEEIVPSDPAPTPPKPRTRKPKAAPLQEGDKGYGSARAHAVAAERGLDHAAIHRIAFDVLWQGKHEEGDSERFSVANIDEDDWPAIIEALLQAPEADDAVSVWAGEQAVAALDLQAEDPWPEIDAAATEMFGLAADSLSVAEWREFGIRIEARHPLP